MKTPGIAAILMAALVFAGCRKVPTVAPASPTPEEKKGHPVVHIPPVETRPFEDGYGIGFTFGKRQATPHSKLPTEQDAQYEARQQASGHPERTERWERGFAEGYVDGVRNVVTGQK